ncbi:class I SAM-dependent methyltransferase family protein [Methanobrevibacter sp. OttesenSCG-928-K11]|nr:class I SAM-dependent methyltransferase family protein [Methanobrevibacter sp. OttesenSCG-928-K11]MDL2271124.1 class I SAM-dependent methyltransferase family protein [Methanobrevibacter sp. OttesenSCG-928-I08]
MKWKKIGKVLILDKNEKNLSETYLNELLTSNNVDTIIKINNIYGTKRMPNIEILKGSDTETIHKENGCFFKLDLSKVMWSKGNVNERLRIAKLIKPNETVLDMFAGIGYFSIPIGVHSKAKKIYSIEINPNSYGFLKENIELNKINKDYNRMEAILGDSKELTSNYKVDRIIMGYVKTTHHYLKIAIGSLNPGGILHYHETVPLKLINTRPINRIKNAAGDRDVNIITINKIKQYAPGVAHIVVDAQIN